MVIVGRACARLLRSGTAWRCARKCRGAPRAKEKNCAKLSGPVGALRGGALLRAARP
jgi:hypothetical protein